MQREIPDDFDKVREKFMAIATKRERDLYLSLMEVNESYHAYLHMKKTLHYYGELLKNN